VLEHYAPHIRIESWLESRLPAGDPKYYHPTRPLFGSTRHVLK
jgi:hypothetical protein